MIMQELRDRIESAFKNGDKITATHVDPGTREAILRAIDLLENGELRVAQNINGAWVVNEWLKKAVLLYFRISEMQHFSGSYTDYYDKIPTKFSNTSSSQFQEMGVRVVPPACARRGAYIGPNTVLMPSYVNIGAYVDSGVLVDTWATVGSCAQIGKNVHLSGGVGIGGVLEPIGNSPTIIEDDCFIGARSEIVEGVVVEKGSVISMGVYLGQSTRIYNRLTGEITFGRIPAGSVVVPGNLPAKDGSHSLYCAVIVKQVDQKTREKTAINDLLRIME
jgi:2,3,4,5-tetrahydropyridine-2,6-dicarboxylate N-succinyltransferase